MNWITTGQLDIWARARVSETQLPGVISDLMRGVTMRGLYNGGAQERELVIENREHAAKAAAWPRTAALLTAIADYWDRDAEREDVEANKRRLRS